jgi:hypothetical protein
VLAFTCIKIVWRLLNDNECKGVWIAPPVVQEASLEVLAFLKVVQVLCSSSLQVVGFPDVGTHITNIYYGVDAAVVDLRASQCVRGRGDWYRARERYH